VLYEMHNKRPSPAQWTKTFVKASRYVGCCSAWSRQVPAVYDFRDRLAPYWDNWNAQVLQQALTEGMTSAARASLDSIEHRANASRRKLLNEERLHQRQQMIDEQLRSAQCGEPVAEKPGWLAKTTTGLHEQKRRYAHAAEIMVRAARGERTASVVHAQASDKVLVSPSDPEAALARDKENVFRPLYTVAVAARPSIRP